MSRAKSSPSIHLNIFNILNITAFLIFSGASVFGTLVARGEKLKLNWVNWTKSTIASSPSLHSQISTTIMHFYVNYSRVLNWIAGRWNSIQMSDQKFRQVKILFEFLVNCQLKRGQNVNSNWTRGARSTFLSALSGNFSASCHFESAPE